LERKSTSRRAVYQLVKEGQIGKAIETFSEFLASGEAGPYDFVYMGDLLMRTEQVTEAIARYEEAIAAYARLGFNRNAIALTRKILRLDGSRNDLQCRLGDFHAAEESIGDALHAYFAYLERASAEERQEDSFRETLQRMEELAPQRADFAVRVSEFCRRIERFDSAVAILMRAVQVAEAAGRDEEAAELRERLTAVGSTMPSDGGFSTSDLEAEEVVDDLATSGEAREISGEDLAEEATAAAGRAGDPGRWNEVNLASEQGNPDEAGVDRDDFRTHYQRGVVFMEQGRLEEALAEFEAASRDYDLTGDQGAQLQETRGRCFSALGRHREAIREFTLLMQSPSRTEMDQAGRLVLLAREYEAVGELDEARKRLREALALRPDFAEAAGYLDQIGKKAA